MPSFRVTLIVGAIAPGVAPSRVLPTARDAAQTLTVVEASDVQVVAGEARLIVRFAAESREIAMQIGGHVASTVSTIATVASWRVTERVKSAWL